MAYAAVISLKNTIERLKDLINNPQITKSADDELQSIASMLERLDGSSFRGIERSGIDELDAKIREAVWELEDVLESYALRHSAEDKGVEQEIESFLKTMEELSDRFKTELVNPVYRVEDDVAAVSPVAIHHESTTVGLSDLSDKIINDLLLDVPSTDTVSLLGMAGLGKTHLARDIYHHPLIVQHFDSRAWVRLGPKDQNLDNILADIVAQIEHKPRNSLNGRSRRYLFILDDVWNGDVLDLQISLPGDKDASPVFLVTTRLRDIAEHRWISRVYRMPFLNNEESWNLLWQNVFVDEKYFPCELEEAGRKIAEICEGLPLLILTVANILRGLDKTEKYWNMVAEKKTTTFTDAYEQIYKVLLPSYEYLPQYLKPCFLYMGVFPQGCVIPFSKLSNLWVVEDLIEPLLFQSLESSAKQCLKGLVSTSVAITCKSSFQQSLSSSKLHSTYWYLCVKEAKKIKFFHVLNKLTDVSLMESQRRLSFQNNILLGIKEVYDSMAAATSSTTRSLLCTGEYHQYPVPICLNMMMLLKVLDALAIRFYEFPEEVLKLLQLRYLSLTHNGELPASISKLQLLQCLILRQHHNIKFPTAPTACLPDEIWNMQELRHLRIMGSNLPVPRYGVQLQNLLTLYVNGNSCTEAVFRSIPYLKKLGIKIELQPDAGDETLRCLKPIELLDILESLKCVVVNPLKLVVAPPEHISNLPWHHIRKLSLSGLGYSWKYISKIGSVSCLEVLKLRCSAFQGLEWETDATQFQGLKYLLLEDIDLVHWTANPTVVNSRDYKCFPSLQQLTVGHCYKLKKIPCEIGDTETLEKLEVEDCSPSVVESAQHIKDKSKSARLEVVITSSWNL